MNPSHQEEYDTYIQALELEAQENSKMSRDKVFPICIVVMFIIITSVVTFETHNDHLYKMALLKSGCPSVTMGK